MSLVPPYIESLSPYVPGKPIEEVEREYGVSNVVKLASNENPLGPSPKALAAAREACGNVHLYPDGAAFFLKRALARKHDVSPDEIMIGNGSCELLTLLVRTFVLEDEEVVTSAQSFVIYALAAKSHGRRLVEVPMRPELGYDLPAIRERVTRKTKLVFLANPDNPTGTYLPRDQVVSLLDSVSPETLVVLDEAYFEFASADDYPNGLELRKRYPNLVTLRTFSKIYGLAGLRVGYGVARPEVVAMLDRIRDPFNVNLVAQVAAIAALGDEEHVRRSRALVESERPFVIQGLEALGARITPSQANFVLADFPGKPGRELFEALLREGVVVRPMGGYGFPTAQRITFGLRPENEKLLTALRKVLGR
jgi:histidinol-phosphate aminotransferase